MFLEGLIFTVLVIGLVVGACAFTYFLSIFVDRFCSSPYATERIFSPISNKANLWGMGKKERGKVLEKVFQQQNTLRVFNKNDVVAKASSTKNSKTDILQPKEIEMTDLSSANDDAESTTHAESLTNGSESEVAGAHSGTTFDPPSEATPTGVLESTIDLSPEQLETMCSICLVEYENGDKVMTGTACSHLFHFHCIMEWMQKGHDHCPFCREPMMAAQDMRTAALSALGEKRVEQLSRGNEGIQTGENNEDETGNVATPTTEVNATISVNQEQVSSPPDVEAPQSPEEALNQSNLLAQDAGTPHEIVA